MSNGRRRSGQMRPSPQPSVIRLSVIGEDDSGKAELIATFGEYLTREPPRKKNGEIVTPQDEAPIGDGEVGYDAIGRRVCAREISARYFAASPDEFSGFASMPQGLRDHLAKSDGAVIVVDAFNYRDAARRWRRLLAVIRPECPALLLLAAATRVDEGEVARFSRDIGIIAWRSIPNSMEDDPDAVLDAFGTILDYISATLKAGEFAVDAIEDDDPPSSHYGITCAGSVPSDCALM
ncbi:hypothetical protein CTAYLR_004935 [Chrysophaeum taylorii]|uniref:Uncharacterized protein n=1 Tax=Chrysophaeum taylorii TaxID=2483200 RepID=A0AAD7XRT9_9STRA|nr:hypothetical protein CTAYLR_004935 [Chrysophaeum taylorii]